MNDYAVYPLLSAGLLQQHSILTRAKILYLWNKWLTHDLMWLSLQFHYWVEKSKVKSCLRNILQHVCVSERALSQSAVCTKKQFTLLHCGLRLEHP